MLMFTPTNVSDNEEELYTGQSHSLRESHKKKAKESKSKRNRKHSSGNAHRSRMNITPSSIMAKGPKRRDYISGEENYPFAELHLNINRELNEQKNLTIRNECDAIHPNTPFVPQEQLTDSLVVSPMLSQQEELKGKHEGNENARSFANALSDSYNGHSITINETEHKSLLSETTENGVPRKSKTRGSKHAEEKVYEGNPFKASFWDRIHERLVKADEQTLERQGEVAVTKKVLENNNNDKQDLRVENAPDEFLLTFFWSKPLRAHTDMNAHVFFIEGLQQLDFALELIASSTEETPKLIATAFVNRLIRGSIEAFKINALKGPPGLYKKVVEFRTMWEWFAFQQSYNFHTQGMFVSDFGSNNPVSYSFPSTFLGNSGKTVNGDYYNDVLYEATSMMQLSSQSLMNGSLVRGEGIALDSLSGNTVMDRLNITRDAETISDLASGGDIYGDSPLGSMPSNKNRNVEAFSSGKKLFVPLSAGYNALAAKVKHGVGSRPFTFFCIQNIPLVILIILMSIEHYRDKNSTKLVGNDITTDLCGLVHIPLILISIMFDAIYKVSCNFVLSIASENQAVFDEFTNDVGKILSDAIPLVRNFNSEEAVEVRRREAEERVLAKAAAKGRVENDGERKGIDKSENDGQNVNNTRDSIPVNTGHPQIKLGTLENDNTVGESTGGERCSTSINSNVTLGGFSFHEVKKSSINTGDSVRINGNVCSDDGSENDLVEHAAMAAHDDLHAGLCVPPSFLLNSDDALQRKRSVDALLVEADDEGCITLRVKGLSKVTLDMMSLNQHLMIVVADLQGKVVYWNEGAASVCGFNSHDAEGKHITSFLFGEKACAVYEKMADAAMRGVDLSAKPLTVANSTYGHATVKATVTSAMDAQKEVMGFVIIASQQETDSCMNQAAFHQHFLHEVIYELRSLCADRIDSLGSGLGRCGKMLDYMGWNYLRDLSSSTKDWSPTLIQSLLNEALKDRHRQVDVRISSQLQDQIVCDQYAVSYCIAQTLSLLSGKLRLHIGHKSSSEVLNQLVVTAGPAGDLNESHLEHISKTIKDIGGDVSLGANHSNEILLVFPYLIEGAGGNNLFVIQKDLNITANALSMSMSKKKKKTTPITILLLEKNAVYRHNISTIAWSCGHSLRLVDTVGKAMKALSEGAAQFGCAIIDIDIREVTPLVDSLRSNKVFLIETTENDPTLEKNRESDVKTTGSGSIESIVYASVNTEESSPPPRIVLSKPLSKTVLQEKLEEASVYLLRKKKAEEEKLKRCEIFGKVRNSPWTRGKKLGQGAFADVYEATNILTGGKMAVKMIKFNASSAGEEKTKVLMNEIQILCQLSHPNIIHYFYCEHAESSINLFMELADEGSILDLVKREGGVLTEVKLSGITKQLLQAVVYLHNQGILHRDIKPGNILLSGGKVKLTDFGTATQNVADDTQGTIYYMAPEVLDGITYGSECDIWSVGCVVCECLGIKRGPRPDSLLGYGLPETFPSHISDAVIEFITLCMQYDPSERATAGSLLLHDFIVGEADTCRNDPQSILKNADRMSVTSTWTVGGKQSTASAEQSLRSSNPPAGSCDNLLTIVSLGGASTESTPSW